MQSHVCVIEKGSKDLDTILKECEKVAEYNGLTDKQALQLRLLCEEVDGMLPNIIDDFSGKLWIEYDSGVCKVNVSIKIPDLNAGKKKELIEISTGKKNSSAVGIVGKIRNAIEDFLSACGATGAAMDLMLKKVERELRNDINRKVNCETANLTKTVGAAAKQIAAIEHLQEKGVLETLPTALQQTAYFRLANPEMSLAELCNAFPEPISRPGLNNRLRRLVQLAEEAKK